MRVLVVTNYYPPHFVGGYELGCFDVVESLKKRGHTFTILTSNFNAAKGGEEPGIWRILRLQSEAGRPGVLRSAAAFLRVVFLARPDVVYFWNQAGLSFWLAPVARLIGLRCLFFISDTSFVTWRVGAFLRRWFASNSVSSPMGKLRKRIKSGLEGSVLLEGRMIIEGQHCEFASEFLRSLPGTPGRSAEISSIIHWGIDADRFQFRPLPLAASPLKLLYVGQIIPEKGIHTAVEATAIIVQRLGKGRVTLTIVGGSSKAEYLAEQRARVRELGLEDAIQFLGKVRRSDLPAVYAGHDILIFPSVWDEPFAITPLEAMASGLPVVATLTGGSAEIFKDRENSLVFAAEDAEACAEAIMELRANTSLYQDVRRRGRDSIHFNFSLKRMVDQIEEDLKCIAGTPKMDGVKKR